RRYRERAGAVSWKYLVPPRHHLPSAGGVVGPLLGRLPLLLTSTTYPEPALLQVTMAPSVESLCGVPSQIVFGPALPCRVTTYPVASVASDIVGPSYLRVAGSIFHEPFH